MINGMRCLILSFRRFAFEGKLDGKHIEGVSVSYLDPTCVENSEERRGVFPLQISTTNEVATKLTQLPGVYECDFGRRAGRFGKPEMVLREVEFSGGWNLESTLSGKLSASK